MFTKHLLSKYSHISSLYKSIHGYLTALSHLAALYLFENCFLPWPQFLRIKKATNYYLSKRDSFFSTGVTLYVFLNTYLPQALSHYIVHYMVCSENDASDRQHPKSITVWLSVSKNKFYTLTKVWGHSCKGPATYYFPSIPMKNHYIDHIQKEGIITHSRIKILEELWMLISRNRC